MSERTFWRGCLILVLGAFAALLVWLVLRTSNAFLGARYFVLPDDGMISMRFARNLTAGRGWVWNTGERVQGFTNFAWTLLMALVHLTPLPDRLTSLVLQIASVMIHLLTAGYIWRRTKERISPAWALAAMAGYLSSSCTTCWAISGWETSIVTLGWAIALDPLLVRHQSIDSRGVWRSLFAAALTVLFRPDAELLFIALVIYWLLKTSPRSVLIAIVASSVFPIALGVFQRLYYGSYVPNTAVLKRSAGVLSFIHGFEYLFTSLLRYPFNGAVLIGAAIGARWLEKSERLLLGGLASAYLFYLISVGGDAFTHARFLLPLLPTATILTAETLSRITFAGAGRKGFAWRVWGILSIALLSFDLADEVLVDVPGQKNLNRLALITSEAIHVLSDGKDPLIGVFAAGAVPYFNPRLRFHDLLGKSDVHIARSEPHSGQPGHNHWDYDYSLANVRPDLIVTTYPLPRGRPPRYQTGFRAVSDFYQDLYDQAEFAKLYLPHPIPIRADGEGGQGFEAYAREDGKLANVVGP